MADKPINIALGTLDETAAASSSIVLRLGQRVTIHHTDVDDPGHLREYEGDGTSTIAMLVAAGRYRPSNAALEALAETTKVPVDQVEVTGSGNALCNGTYTRNDAAYTGVFARMANTPVYTNGTYVIVRSSTYGVWMIYHAGNDEVQYVGNDMESRPWLSNGFVEDQGASPPPEVTQLTTTLATAADGTPGPGKLAVAGWQGTLHAALLPGQVRACGPSAVNLAALPATMDGVTMAKGDLFLAPWQPDPKDNGVYLYMGSGAAAQRAWGYDTWPALAGALISVHEGTTWKGTVWQCAAPATGTLGATAQPWRHVAGTPAPRTESADFSLNASAFSHCGTLLHGTKATTQAITLPAKGSGPSPQDKLFGVQMGAGQHTINTPLPTDVEVRSRFGSLTTAGQYAPYCLEYLGEISGKDVYLFTGDLE